MSSTTTQTKEEPEPLQQEVTVATPPSSTSDKSKDNGVECKKTVGEELFLVHLNRFDKLERSPDDFDHTTNPKEVVETVPPASAEVEAAAAPEAEASASDTITKEAAATATVTVIAPDSTRKIRSASIGEELWEVHCRRSQGLPPDYDEDNDDNENITAAVDSDKQQEQSKKKAGGKKKKAESAAATHPKRSKVVVEPREIHLRNRDVKVQVVTASTKGH